MLLQRVEGAEIDPHPGDTANKRLREQAETAAVSLTPTFLHTEASLWPQENTERSIKVFACMTEAGLTTFGIKRILLFGDKKKLLFFFP